jgi:23S rRNA (cytosine1962-C5)-methyltransferase
MRRGNKYHGVILDPPSFGRGTKGEVWKIEEHLAPFLRELAKLLDDQWLFALLSAHSPGVTPMSLQNLLVDVLDRPDQELHFESQEMLVADKAGSCPLPSGAFSLCLRR